MIFENFVICFCKLTLQIYFSCSSFKCTSSTLADKHTKNIAKHIYVAYPKEGRSRRRNRPCRNMTPAPLFCQLWAWALFSNESVSALSLHINIKYQALELNTSDLLTRACRSSSKHIKTNVLCRLKQTKQILWRSFFEVFALDIGFLCSTLGE